MNPTRSIDDASLDGKLTETFAALANSTRRAILARLAEGEASVNEIAEPFDASPIVTWKVPSASRWQNTGRSAAPVASAMRGPPRANCSRPSKNGTSAGNDHI